MKNIIENVIPIEENRPFFGKFWPMNVTHQFTGIRHEIKNNSTRLGDVLKQTALETPQNKAIWFANTWMTYDQLYRHVQSFATALVTIGVKKGDVIAIFMPNLPQYVIAYYAAVTIGAIASGINPTYKTAEVANQVKTTGAKVIVVMDALLSLIYDVQKTWKWEKIIITKLPDCITPLPTPSDPEKIKVQLNLPEIDFRDCLQLQSAIPEVTIDPFTDPAVYMMTGGTTGVPKAAVLTHANLIANALQFGQVLTTQSERKKSIPFNAAETGSIAILPFYHSFSMTAVMNTSILTGMYLLIFPKPPLPEDFLQQLGTLPFSHKIVFCGVEPLFQKIGELSIETLTKYPARKQFWLCVSGATPLHDYVRNPFEEKTGAKITEGYGLAEASPICSLNNFYGERDSGFIGVPLPGTDWRIFDAADFNKGPIENYSENGTGELCVSGPQVMLGYLNNIDATKDCIREWQGRKWLLTGDIGWMDQHGRVQLKDRKKQLIKVKGFSAFPTDIETLMGEHPAIRDIVVAGIPDPDSGEAVKAWIVLKSEFINKITAEEIRDWAKAHVAPYKVPKFVEFIDQVPRTSVGKVLRRELQEKDPLWIQGKK